MAMEHGITAQENSADKLPKIHPGAVFLSSGKVLRFLNPFFQTIFPYIIYFI